MFLFKFCYNLSYTFFEISLIIVLLSFFNIVLACFIFLCFVWGRKVHYPKFVTVDLAPIFLCVSILQFVHPVLMVKVAVTRVTVSMASAVQ